MTIYLDIIWLLNFIFDCLILLLTAIILKQKLSYFRIALGGFIGSLIVLLSFTSLNYIFSNILVKFIYSLIIVLATFGYKQFNEFVKTVGAFYFVTFLLGGSLIGLNYFLMPYTALASFNNYMFGDPISWLFVLIVFPFAWYFSKVNIEKFEMTKIDYDKLVNIAVVIDGETYKFTGLVDSGNSLYDPLGRTPVILVSLHDELKKYPTNIINFAKLNNEFELNNDLLNHKVGSKIRLIPCRVVGQEHKILVAVKVEKVIVHANEKVITNKNVLVSFLDQQLSPENKYNCIVHPKLMVG